MRRQALIARSTIIAGSMVALISCGDSSSSDSSSTNEDGTVAVNVGSLNGLPDMTAVIGASSGTSLALAVNGTPPLFKDINKDSIESLLSGSISDLKAAVVSANSSNDKDTLRSKVSTFHEGVAKCHVIQDAARTLKEISTFTGSSCYMSKIDNGTNNGLTYVSGTEVEKGKLFEQKDDTRVVAMNITDGASLEGGGPERIVFEIQGRNVEAGVYQVKLNFCGKTSGVASSYDLIRVDNAKGRLIIKNKQKESFGNYLAEIDAPIRPSTTTSGAFEFMPGLKRVIKLHGKGGDGNAEFRMQARLELEKDILTSAFRGEFKFDHDGDGTYTTNRDKSVSRVRLDGSKTTETRIFEGAGRHIGDFQDEAGSRHTNDNSIGFEFDDSASPKYKSVSTGSYVDFIKNFKPGEDETLKADSIGDVDVADINNSPCALSPESTYELNMGSSDMVNVVKECESGFDGDEAQLCDGLHGIEDTIISAKSNQGI